MPSLLWISPSCSKVSGIEDESGRRLRLFGVDIEWRIAGAETGTAFLTGEKQRVKSSYSISAATSPSRPALSLCVGSKMWRRCRDF